MSVLPIISDASLRPKSLACPLLPRMKRISIFLKYDAYDVLYAHEYGKFRLERISRVVDRFESCATTPRVSPGSSVPIRNADWSSFVLFPAKASTPRAGKCTAFAGRARRNALCCSPNTSTSSSCSISPPPVRLLHSKSPSGLFPTRPKAVRRPSGSRHHSAARPRCRR